MVVPPLAEHQGVPDEHVASRGRIDAVVGNAAPVDDGHAVQRDALRAHRAARALGPQRIGVRARDEVAGQRLDPRRVDARGHASPQAGGLDELGSHDPLGEPALSVVGPSRRPGQGRAGPEGEPPAPCAEILPAAAARARRGVLVAGLEAADVRQQAGENGAMQRVGVAHRGRLGGVPYGVADLVDEVLPFAHAQVVEELLAAQAPECRGGHGSLRRLEVAPQREERHEVRGRVVESRVGGVGGLLAVLGALARIADGESGGDDDDVVEAAFLGPGDHHAPEPRIERDPREASADVRHPLRERVVAAGRTQGPDLLEEGKARGDVARVGRVDEGEVRDLPEAQRGHLEQHGRKVGAQDLRLGELRSAIEVGFGVQADADAVGDAAASARALLGARPRDRLDGQPLHLEAVAEAGDARGPGVDDVVDAGDGERRLGDVRAHDDAALVVGREDAVLLGAGEPAVEGKDLGARRARVAEGVNRVAHLALAGAEHEDVAGALVEEFVDGLADGLHLVDVVRRGAVARLHGKGATGDLDDGDVVDAESLGEVRGDALRIERGRGDDDAQVRSAGE